MAEIHTVAPSGTAPAPSPAASPPAPSPDAPRPAVIRREDFVRVGPGTLCGRYLRTFWHPVVLADQLPPGGVRPLRILGEDLTLYRGEGGAFHAVAQRCAHRGTQLSTGWVEGDCIRCFYHGWKYDGGGQCVEQPDEDPRFATRIRVRSYPVRHYLGFVFVYFGEGEPPELPRFRNFEDETDSIVQRHGYTWPCSYFNSMENDSYHGNWVHRDTYAAIGRLPANGEQQVTAEETDYGIVSHITRRGTDRFGHTDFHRIMPNANYRRASDGGAGGREGQHWTEALNWRVPIDDEHFTTCIIDRIHGSPAALERYREKQRERRELRRSLRPPIEIAERILAGETSFKDFPGRMEGVSDPRLFAIGDYCTQVGQGPFGVLNDEHLGRTDVEVAMLRRIYRRELKALAEGRPLKRWTLPDQFVVRVSED